ncbi:hypothetical protein SAMN04487910_0549 [Aquimarina amphilecti]|uniref:Uncharacterized protein n=1 Tax=Aquimarina amphilecti TaxID=1038014 RepID=A0A1H7H4P3_AQUAM|nr:hypothetical protein [Aquimarina amphilecti]SEK44717.1 hypothetical protein SAMN04487910_0549 [Aquimarina amphilecti]
MENQNKKKSWSKRKFADFQNKYRRSSNFGYGSKRDKFAIAGDGELAVLRKKNSDDMNIMS